MTISSVVSVSVNQQLATIAQKRIFFGHQSVGSNILDGVRELVASSPGAKLDIFSLKDLSTVNGPGLFETTIGRNKDPESKDSAFAGILHKGYGNQSGIAFYKYCYVDISGSTDIQKMFSHYRENIDRLKATFPSIRFVHVTIPLTTVETSAEAWLKSLLNHRTEREANQRRNEFNRLLRETYRGDPIFDLAEVESTHPNGSRSFFISDGQRVYTLCSEYTTDGGHLNALGRRHAAEALMALLALT